MEPSLGLKIVGGKTTPSFTPTDLGGMTNRKLGKTNRKGGNTNRGLLRSGKSMGPYYPLGPWDPRAPCASWAHVWGLVGQSGRTGGRADGQTGEAEEA